MRRLPAAGCGQDGRQKRGEGCYGGTNPARQLTHAYIVSATARTFPFPPHQGPRCDYGLIGDLLDRTG